MSVTEENNSLKKVICGDAMLIHDGSSIHLANSLSTALCIDSVQVIYNTHLELLDPAIHHVDTWICTFDALHWPDALQLQNNILSANSQVLFVILQPDVVWVGATARPGQKGCLSCFMTRINSNTNRSPHWTQAWKGFSHHRKSSLAPLPQSIIGLLTTIIIEKLRTLPKDIDSMTCFQIEPLQISKHICMPVSTCQHCQPLQEDRASGAVLHFHPHMKRNISDTRIKNSRLHVKKLRERFIDRSTGVIRHIYLDTTSNLMPMFGAEMKIIGSDVMERGFGRAETRSQSELVAILETLERYAGHRPRRNKSRIRGSYSAVSQLYPDQVLDPHDLILHDIGQASEAGYTLIEYNNSLEFDWCWGYSMRNRCPILVPQQAVYYWLDDSHGNPANRFIYDSSNGCAMGGSIEEAIMHGLCEVVERDAYLTTWYGRLTPISIKIETITEPRSRLLINRATSEGYEIYVFDLRTGINFPIILAMIVDPAPDARVKSYCASAASVNWSQAVFSALVEITTSMRVYQHTALEWRSRANKMLLDSSRVQEMQHHIELHSHPESYSRLEFLFNNYECSYHDVKTGFPHSFDLTDEMLELVKRTLVIAKDVIVVDLLIFLKEKPHSFII